MMVSAQQNKVVSAFNYLRYYEQDHKMDDLMKAKQAIDEATANEDTKDKPKTWYYRAKVYHNLFNQKRTDEAAKITEPDPDKKTMASFKAVSTEYLDEAYNAYKKAMELDVKKNYTDDIVKALKDCNVYYGYKAYAMLADKNYSEALKYYEQAVEIKSKMFNQVDTASINNMAICADRMKDYPKAVELYNKLIGYKYDPVRSYLSIIRIYKAQNDLTNARAYLDKARAAYPQDMDIIIEDINFYLNQDKSQDAINLVKMAIEKDPKNPQFYVVLGQTYYKMAFPKDKDGKDLPKPKDYSDLIKNSETAFNKALEVKPDYQIALYNIGALYRNIGADMYNESQNIKDMNKSKQMEDAALAYYKKAIPFLEKSLEMDKTDRDTMKILKELYAKTGDNDKYNKMKEMLKN